MDNQLRKQGQEGAWMKQLLPAAFSVMTLSLTFVIQNVLFLSTASLVYLYECIAAVELYSAMCLLYFSLRFWESRSPNE